MLGRWIWNIMLAAALIGSASGCGSDSAGSDSSVTTASVSDATGLTEPSVAPAATDVAMVSITLVFPKVTDTGFDFVPVAREMADTPEIERAALELLLSGPTAEEETTLDVADPFAYTSGIRLLSLEIDQGTATADFSSNLLDYGGGSANVEAIGSSITRTLQEFPTIDEVVILVEGEPDQIQP